MLQQVPITFDLNLANLLVMILSGSVAYVWKTLNEKILAENDKVKVLAQTLFEKSQDRVTRIEQDISALPSKIDELSKAIKQLELSLAVHYPTRQELDKLVKPSKQNSEEIEDLVSILLSEFSKKNTGS